jgi:hypothetical protein
MSVLMNRRVAAGAGLTLTIAALGGCAGQGGSGPRPVAAASGAQQAVLLDQVKKLEGEWQGVDEHGNKQTVTIFKVSSNGSVVREIMMPGTEHEMTNIYHMDGPSLILTHYCAMGNQPRMRAQPGDGHTLDFKTDSVTNWTSPSQLYMGEMSLEIKDPTHIIEHWSHIKDGKTQGHTSMELTRKG